MRKFAADNLMLLRKDYHNVYEHFRGFRRDPSKVGVEQARNGLANLTIQHEGKPVRLYSQYDPAAECGKWLEQTAPEVEGREHVLLFGLGLGYHAEAFIARYPDKNLYIFEPNSEVFITFIETRSMKPVLKNKSIAALAIGSESHIMYGITKMLAENTNKGFAFISIPVYQRLYKELLSEFRKEATTVLLDYRSNLATSHWFREEWPRNIIKNFAEVIRTPEIAVMKDACSNIPAIIVGSGPSLQEDIPLLKEIQDRCLIISAGTSVQALVHHGVTPDLVVSIDGGILNYDAFKEIDLTQIPLLYTSFVHHQILEKERENSLYVSLGLDKITPYLVPHTKETKVFLSTASVTGTAIQAADYFGCRPIVFTGQDMSYPNDSYYTDGVKHWNKENQKKSVAAATETIENVSGGLNKTTLKLITTLDDLVALIKVFPSQTFINASRYGAKIEGTTFQPLGTWVQEHRFEKVGLEPQWLKRMIADREGKTSNRLSTGFSKLKQLESELREMQQDIDGIFNQMERILDPKPLPKDRKIQYLNQIETKWDEVSTSGLFAGVYSIPVQAQIIIFKRKVPEIVNESDIDKRAALIVEHLGRVIQQMKNITPKMIEWVQEAIAAVENLAVSKETT